MYSKIVKNCIIKIAALLTLSLYLKPEVAGRSFSWPTTTINTVRSIDWPEKMMSVPDALSVKNRLFPNPHL